MPQDRVKRIITAYFERPAKEYTAVIERIKASGGLDSEEESKVRQSVLPVHAETILRHLEQQAKHDSPTAAAAG